MYKVKCRDTEMHIMLHKHMWHNLREGKFSEFSRLENWYHTVLSDLPEKKIMPTHFWFGQTGDHVNWIQNVSLWWLNVRDRRLTVKVHVWNMEKLYFAWHYPFSDPTMHHTYNNISYIEQYNVCTYMCMIINHRVNRNKKIILFFFSNT